MDLRAQRDQNIHHPLPGIGDSMLSLMDIYLQDRGLDQPFDNEHSEQKTNIVHGAGIHLWSMVALRPVFKTDGYGQVA